MPTSRWHRPGRRTPRRVPRTGPGHVAAGRCTDPRPGAGPGRGHRHGGPGRAGGRRRRVVAVDLAPAMLARLARRRSGRWWPTCCVCRSRPRRSTWPVRPVASGTCPTKPMAWRRCGRPAGWPARWSPRRSPSARDAPRRRRWWTASWPAWVTAHRPGTAAVQDETGTSGRRSGSAGRTGHDRRLGRGEGAPDRGAHGLRDPLALVDWRLGMAHNAPFVADLQDEQRAAARANAAGRTDRGRRAGDAAADPHCAVVADRIRCRIEFDLAAAGIGS